MRGPTRIVALTVPIVGLLLGLVQATPAVARQGSGPCDLQRQDDEAVRAHMKRLIRCAADRWEVPGGARRAICVAVVESDLDPEATSAGGDYLGLYQHSAEYWPDRYDTWTRPSWDLDESALSGRTNAIVTIRMVNDGGWGPWANVGDCDEGRPRVRGSLR